MFWQGDSAGPAVVGAMQQWPGETRPVVLVTLLEAAPARLARALRDHGGRRLWRPVFLTTEVDLRALIASGHPVEHLPALAMAQGRETLDWADYLQERWRRVHQKWVPRWTVNYGTDFGAYLIRLGNGATL